MNNEAWCCRTNQNLFKILLIQEHDNHGRWQHCYVTPHRSAFLGVCNECTWFFEVILSKLCDTEWESFWIFQPIEACNLSELCYLHLFCCPINIYLLSNKCNINKSCMGLFCLNTVRKTHYVSNGYDGYDNLDWNHLKNTNKANDMHLQQDHRRRNWGIFH